jgi:hypothetical protein
MMGISRDTLRRRRREWGWKERPRETGVRGSRPAMTPPRKLVTSQHRARPAADSIAAARRRSVASRIMTMLEGELERVEITFKESGVSTDAAIDNRIRALLGVTKMLREVELMTKPDEVIPPNASNNETARDIDEFREALARRIESFVEARQNADGGSDGGAAG